MALQRELRQLKDSIEGMRTHIVETQQKSNPEEHDRLTLKLEAADANVAEVRAQLGRVERQKERVMAELGAANDRLAQEQAASQTERENMMTEIKGLRKQVEQYNHKIEDLTIKNEELMKDAQHDSGAVRRETDAQLQRMRDVMDKSEAKMTHIRDDRDNQVAELRKIMDERQSDFLNRAAEQMKESDLQLSTQRKESADREQAQVERFRLQTSEQANQYSARIAELEGQLEPLARLQRGSDARDGKLREVIGKEHREVLKELEEQRIQVGAAQDAHVKKVTADHAMMMKTHDSQMRNEVLTLQTQKSDMITKHVHEINDLNKTLKEARQQAQHFSQEFKEALYTINSSNTDASRIQAEYSQAIVTISQLRQHQEDTEHLKRENENAIADLMQQHRNVLTVAEQEADEKTRELDNLKAQMSEAGEREQQVMSALEDVQVNIQTVHSEREAADEREREMRAICNDERMGNQSLMLRVHDLEVQLATKEEDRLQVMTLERRLFDKEHEVARERQEKELQVKSLTHENDTLHARLIRAEEGASYVEEYMAHEKQILTEIQSLRQELETAQATISQYRANEAERQREAELAKRNTTAPKPFESIERVGVEPAKVLVGQLFDAINLNGDDSIGESEGKVFLRALGSDAAHLESHWTNLKRLQDRNGDGKLQKDEFLDYVLRTEEIHEDGTFVKEPREVAIRQQYRIATLSRQVDSLLKKLARVQRDALKDKLEVQRLTKEVGTATHTLKEEQLRADLEEDKYSHLVLEHKALQESSQAEKAKYIKLIKEAGGDKRDALERSSEHIQRLENRLATLEMKLHTTEQQLKLKNVEFDANQESAEREIQLHMNKARDAIRDKHTQEEQLKLRQEEGDRLQQALEVNNELNQALTVIETQLTAGSTPDATQRRGRRLEAGAGGGEDSQARRRALESMGLIIEEEGEDSPRSASTARRPSTPGVRTSRADRSRLPDDEEMRTFASASDRGDEMRTFAFASASRLPDDVDMRTQSPPERQSAGFRDATASTEFADEARRAELGSMGVMIEAPAPPKQVIRVVPPQDDVKRKKKKSKDGKHKKSKDGKKTRRPSTEEIEGGVTPSKSKKKSGSRRRPAPSPSLATPEQMRQAEQLRAALNDQSADVDLGAFL